MVIEVDVPAIGRHLANRVTMRAQKPNEVLRPCDASGQTTTDSDDGDFVK
jgi:hypothetical protein